MNRFYNIQFIASRELMPWESAARGLSTRTGLFELAQRLKFRSDIAGGVLILEPGMVSDLASIPTLLQSLTMTCDDQRISGGAWFHDPLYKRGGRIQVFNEDETPKAITQLTRAQCDAILCDEAMPDLGASWLDRWKVKQGLWIGGGFSFQKPASSPH
jgi:hypothetical protein